jgi:membrane protein
MSGKQAGRWQAVRGFFATGLWELRLEALPAWKRAGVQVLRVLTLAVRESVKDECGLRAASLTFYTLLSVVPVLGVAFGIAKGFGLEKLLEEQLQAQMAGQEQALERILGFARNMLEDARGGLIAGLGVALMIWAAVKILGQIEAALNAMWDGLPPRSWGRRFADYLAVLLIAPVLMLSASGANVFLRTGLGEVAGRLGLLDTAGPLIVQTLKLTPVLLAWALFALMYAMMPNTRVRLLPALAGGAVGGVLYHLVQWAYIAFQVGAAKQNAIYGSFAALPLFLAWVQTSWMIFLFGAQVAYATQHAELWACCMRGPAAGRDRRQLAGLHAAWLVAGRFARGESPLTAAGIARAAEVPPSVVAENLERLTRAGLLARAVSPEGEAFLPAVDPTRLTLQRVWDALQESDPLDPAALPVDAARLQDALAELKRAAADSTANRPLGEIR